MLPDNTLELDGFRVGGIGNPVRLVGIAVESGGIRSADAFNPVGENRLFGRDYAGPPVFRIRMRVSARTGEAAAAARAGLEVAWDAASVRATPGTESVLRLFRAGRVLRVYGRARGLISVEDRTHYMGRVLLEGTFHLSEGLYFSDDVQSLSVGLIAVNAGGLRAPLRAPLTASPGSSRQGLVTVGGDSPAPVEVVFAGPVTNPVASSTDWQIGLNATLAYDQTVTVNARTGTALRNDGVSLAGALTRRTYLPEARMRPGAREIVFAGTDPTGLSSCTVRWRNTYKSF
ncbi:hypothetical protein ACFQ9D_11970 [Arthrobacter koreensis]|uniref:hypothetical protein n=1 Tax=Arthrobacter koreensis TaxID=199136 RepID=UPI003635B0AC